MKQMRHHIRPPTIRLSSRNWFMLLLFLHLQTYMLNSESPSYDNYNNWDNSVFYLASSEHAKPPSFQSAGILFQYGQDVSFAKGQLVGRLGDVVVQGFGYAILFQNIPQQKKIINIFIIIICVQGNHRLSRKFQIKVKNFKDEQTTLMALSS